MQRLGPERVNTIRLGLMTGAMAMALCFSSAHAWQFRDVTDLRDATQEEPADDLSNSTELPAVEVEPLAPVAVEEKPEQQAQLEDPKPADVQETEENTAEQPVEEQMQSDDEALLENRPPAEEPSLTLSQIGAPEKINGKYIPDDDPENSDPIRPMRFNGLLVGTSTADRMVEAWGEPFRSLGGDGHRTAKYRIEPFRQIDVSLVDGIVESILIYLAEPLDAAHCVSQLRISDLRAVPIPTNDGGILGLVFPERGVVFSNVHDDPESTVGKIQLEMPNAESFALRAEYDFENRFESDLSDIDQALAMDPEYGRAHHVKARILAAVGRYHDALEAANRASNLESDNDLYLLTEAELLGLNGNYESAVRLVKGVLEIADLKTAARALGELLLGDLIAKGPTPRYKESLQHHLRAIELAAPFANDMNFEDRRRAKQILLQAHLGIARDISRGQFQRQQEVVPKWIRRADALAEEMIRRDQADPFLRLKVRYTEIATLADFGSADDPTDLINDARAVGHRLIDQADDPLDLSRLKWELGVVLAEAIHVQRLRGDLAGAMKLTDEALLLLKESALRRQSTPEQKHTVGRLYFHVGSLNAVQDKDHKTAVIWYKKAQPLLMGDLPVRILASPGNHGEAFVSMGVSYWNLKQREKAIDLTEGGADILQQAVVDGILAPDALTIPYRNLASMHKLSGNEDDARAFLALAAALKTTNQPVTAH